MQARDVQDHLRSLDGGWVDPEETVDTFKAGDPATDVDAVAVAWMPYRETLEEAVDRGCDLLVTHEPTYYDNRDDPAELPPGAREAAERKRAYLEETGLVVLRCHDLWDKYPETGVPDTWGRQLGLADGEEVVRDGYYRVYEGEPRSAREAAVEMARRVGVGQPGVELVGPDDATVERVAIGTGAITPVPELLDAYDPDMVVATDDGFFHWRGGALARDVGVPVAVFNHATSEVLAIRNLAEELDDALDVPVHHLEQECTFDLVP